MLKSGTPTPAWVDADSPEEENIPLPEFTGYEPQDLFKVTGPYLRCAAQVILRDFLAKGAILVLYSADKMIFLVGDVRFTFYCGDGLVKAIRIAGAKDTDPT